MSEGFVQLSWIMQLQVSMGLCVSLCVFVFVFVRICVCVYISSWISVRRLCTAVMDCGHGSVLGCLPLVISCVVCECATPNVIEPCGHRPACPVAVNFML